MAQDLGTGYILIQPSTKGLGKAIEDPLNTAVQSASKSGGRTILSKVGGAFKTVGKVGLAAIGTIGGGLAALTAKGGFDRALNIERAQTKLKALGHDTQSVDAIMDDALKSVQGTAFGLGDAASVAATLVASGIQSGTQLQQVLGTVGDAAQIAGVGFKDMGVIFSQVAAKGKLQGDEMLQLMQAGIPVLQYLADHFHTTTAAAQEMVSDGQVSFADFEAAMREHIGGAAQSAGESFDGMVGNVKAALSRLGEGFATPLINEATKLGGHVIPLIDQVAGSVEGLADTFAGRLSEAADALASILDGLNQRFEDGSLTMGDLAGQAGLLAGGLAALAGVGGNVDGILSAFDALGSIPGRLSGLPKAFESIKGPLSAAGGLFTDLAGRWGNAMGLIDANLGGIFGIMGNRVKSGMSDVGGTLVGLFDSKIYVPASRKLSRLGDVIGTPFRSLAGKVGGWLSPVTSSFATAFNGFGARLGGAMQGALSTVGGIVAGFFNPASFMKFVGIGAIVAALVAGLGMLDQSMQGQLSAMIDQMAAEGPEIITRIGEGVTAALPGLIASGAQIVVGLANALTANLPALLTVGGQILNGLMQGLATALPTLLPAAVMLVTTLLQGVIAQLPLLLQGGLQLLQGLIQGIIAALPTLITAVPMIIQTLMTGIMTALPSLMQTGMQILQSIIQGVVSTIPQLAAQIPTIITTMVDGLTSNLPQIVEQGVRMITSLANGLMDALPQLLAQVPVIISNLVSTLASNLPRILQAGVQIIVSLAGGLVQAVPQLIGKIPSIISQIVQAFASTDWLSVGMNIITGIASGIASAAGSLVDAAVNAAKSAIDTVKGWLGIHSPSTRFRDEVGRMIGEGMAIGIRKETDTVSKAGSELAQASMPAAIPLPVVDTSAWLASVRRTAASMTVGLASDRADGASTDGEGSSDIATLLRAILAAIADADTTIQLDGREVGRLVRRYANA